MSIAKNYFAATCSNLFFIVQFFAIIFLTDKGPVFVCGAQHESVSVNRPVHRTAAVNSERISGSTVESTGHTRCFCNLPSCVATGYMCKSASGACFSNLLHHSVVPTAYKGLHGCLEMLTDNEQSCEPNSNAHVNHKRKHHSRSILYCCYSDMCNHADNPETSNLIDESESLYNASKKQPLKPKSQIEELKYSETEVWFKAATIAVPICGTVIVLVLILLAIRLLRSETSHHSRHKLGEKYVPAFNKNNIDVHYRFPVHKEMMPVHHNIHNPVYINHTEELRQIRAPLLLQNELETNSKNTNARYTSAGPFNGSLLEIGRYCNVEKKIGNVYAHSYPEVHQKNLFCDSIVINNALMKSRKYDKSNLEDGT